MLPGFIPRLHAELIRAISPNPVQGSVTPTGKPQRPRPSTHGRYAALRPLIPYFAILNNPAPPPPTTSRASANAGKSPAFTPATMAWIGGSLAGYVLFEFTIYMPFLLTACPCSYRKSTPFSIHAGPLSSHLISRQM